MKLRSITLLALLCAFSNFASANIGFPTLEELLNAFIATYAKETGSLKVGHFDHPDRGTAAGCSIRLCWKQHWILLFLSQNMERFE